MYQRVANNPDRAKPKIIKPHQKTLVFSPSNITHHSLDIMAKLIKMPIGIIHTHTYIDTITSTNNYRRFIISVISRLNYLGLGEAKFD